MINEKKELSFVARDVLSLLRDRKQKGKRGLTSKELILSFYGLVSKQAVFKQISRLKKHKLIKENKIKINKNQFLIIYEATLFK